VLQPIVVFMFYCFLFLVFTAHAWISWLFIHYLYWLSYITCDYRNYVSFNLCLTCFFMSLRSSEISLFWNLQLFYWHFLEILWIFIFIVFYSFLFVFLSFSNSHVFLLFIVFIFIIFWSIILVTLRTKERECWKFLDWR